MLRLSEKKRKQNPILCILIALSISLVYVLYSISLHLQNPGFECGTTPWMMDPPRCKPPLSRTGRSKHDLFRVLVYFICAPYLRYGYELVV